MIDTTGRAKSNEAKLERLTPQSDAPKIKIGKLQEQIDLLTKVQLLENAIRKHGFEIASLKTNQQNAIDVQTRLENTIKNLTAIVRENDNTIQLLRSNDESKSMQLRSLQAQSSSTTTSLERVRNDIIALQTKDVNILQQQSSDKAVSESFFLQILIIFDRYDR